MLAWFACADEGERRKVEYLNNQSDICCKTYKPFTVITISIMLTYSRVPEVKTQFKPYIHIIIFVLLFIK